MKPIGPYVAARDLTPGSGLAPAGVRTVHATDRLTGMPVLLHLLPRPVPLPTLPDHPALLPFTDQGMDGEQAYLVTELPLQARPARDPLLAARGALHALAALHGEGGAHGGVSAAQLWSVDGNVQLAGAGLPWRAQATPEEDLRDLAATLEALGGLPRALWPLRDAPGQLDALSALRALDLPVSGPAPESNRLSPAPPAATQGAEGGPASTGPAQPLHDGSPIILGGDEPGVPPVTGAPDLAAPAVIVASVPPQAEGLTPEPPATPPAAAASARTETPQDRRRRENEERRAQAMLDAQAGARRKAERLRAQAQEEAQRAALTPIQIGFTEGGVEADLPDWPPPAPGQPEGQGAPRLQMRDVERLPASLRREPLPAEAPEDLREEPPAPLEPGRLPGRRVTREPIRIGWDEDDSWRVVHEPDPQPQEQRRGPPRWLLPLLAALVVLAVVLGGVFATRSPAPTPPAAQACCDVTFTVRGAQTPVQLTLVSAPDGANLTPGQELGRAPGQVRFPQAGTYRLRVLADGYAPGSLTLRVPRTQPVNIDLSP